MRLYLCKTDCGPYVAAVINAETAAYQSEKFVTMARRTRQEYLRDLAANHLTDTTLEASPKFCESGGLLRAGPGDRHWRPAVYSGAS